MTFRLAIIAIVGIALGCCARQHDMRLDRAADLAAQYPDSALALLDSIAPASLSTADRHYRDLLSIRAHDKANHPHPSDSLILDVIDYYADHRTAPDHYPMALYYGGRVYRELGDFPTSMKYFQEALDLLPPYTEDQDLRCSVLSQYGTLLDYLRLYDEAVECIKSAIEIQEANRDTANMIVNYQSLAFIYQRARNYDLAEQTLLKSIDLGKNLPYQHTIGSLMTLANVKSRSRKPNEALSIVRNLLDSCAYSDIYSVDLSEVASVYYMAGIYDTTYVYCNEILNGNDFSSKAVAYQMLLSPRMIETLPIDSLGQYIWDYRKLLERFFDNNQTQSTINQQNKYNYQLHEKERAKAEQGRAKMQNYILIALLAISLLVLSTLYFKNKSQRNVIKLREALDNIKLLNNQLKLTASHNADAPSALDGDEFNISRLHSPEAKEKVLREKLKSELLALSERADENYTPDDLILQSAAYQDLQIRIAQAKRINDDDEIWVELENVVHQVSPHFKSNLNLLTLGTLSPLDLHIALLIKCGIKPTPMKEIFGRSHSAITSRRQTLCQKVLGENLGVKAIDRIIRLI